MTTQPFYKKHVFFCVNQKEEGKKCCQNSQASVMCDYTREKLKALGLHGQNGVRVSSSGCMGRCQSGPSIVIYPEGHWYTYKNQADIDIIIEKSIQNDEIIDELLMK